MDVNDNAPVFSEQNYAFTIKEEQPIGTTVGKVSALDRDLGNAGVVTYHVKGTSAESFKILEVCHYSDHRLYM